MNNKKNMVSRMLIAALVFAFVGMPVFQDGRIFADVKKGHKMFKRRLCHTCHAVSPAKKAKLARKGPYLGKIGRKRSRTWLKKQLINPKAMRKSSKARGKKYKKAMKKPRLSSGQMNDLLDYLKTLR